MTVKATVDIVVDDKDVQRLLASFERAVSTLSLDYLLSHGIADALRWRAQNRFTTEGDSASGKWAALRPATEEIREFLGYPRAHPINKRTGDLRKFVGGDHGDSRFMPDGAQLVWPGKSPSGTDRHGNSIEDKLRVAQQGSRRGANPGWPSARTPRRPVVALDQADVALVLGAVGRHLEDSMRLGGFSVLRI